MRNAEIADAFEELGDLYELDGAVVYRVLAYRNAAKAIRDSAASVEDMAREGTVVKLPGVGKTIAEKIDALLETLPREERYLGVMPSGAPIALYDDAAVEPPAPVLRVVQRKIHLPAKQFRPPDELEAAWLACDVLHLSGYALLREPIAETALLGARLARERGARVSVDVAAWTEIRTYGPVRFRELLDELAPDILFATEAEWELLGGAYLTAPVGVLKRGPRGCTVFTEDAKLDFAAVEAEAVDPTGAGDALAAGFLVGGSLEEAARRGLDAAARCVAKVGSLP